MIIKTNNKNKFIKIKVKHFSMCKKSNSILFDVVDINHLDNKNKRFTTIPFFYDNSN